MDNGGKGRRRVDEMPSHTLNSVCVVSCLLWSEPAKSLAALKPEQHGGELNHSPATCESKLPADGRTDTQSGDGRTNWSVAFTLGSVAPEAEASLVNHAVLGLT
ncbi:hypothetical protein EYF80_009557 [Liparis tanakae]|uniref:Uncharacterized protein n=1 Tax=Liparis tanakae TaxID=230148 RepID=A0A4Z2ISH6_9TELE|nr:hypothetical protein EYF80_009557 [Liparis tanakae]